MSKKKDLWYRQTEVLLYKYRSFPIRIMALMQQKELLQEQMLPRTISTYEIREGSSGYNTSSPVENAVINRLEGDAIQKIDREIKELSSLRELIEISIDTMLTDEQKSLIQSIYYQQNSWQKTCDIMSIDKNTYYEKKNEIIKVLSWCFGYLPDLEVQEVLGLFMNQGSLQQSIKKSGKTLRINQEKLGNHKAVL
ncbi:MAG: hypothetical protein VB084_06390 [Syntrophomonadaceae bacterium]|nr:hypothetical protein [Syntrophomonadaceae bacterium]